MACVIGFAIFIMFGWHLWSVGQGETSVESQDNIQYRRIARSRGQVCGPIVADWWRRIYFTRPGVREFV
jgi:hypothetical protein